MIYAGLPEKISEAINKTFEVIENEAYNKAIDDVLAGVKKMDCRWPFDDDQDGEWMISKEDLISQLQQLKKTITP